MFALVAICLVAFRSGASCLDDFCTLFKARGDFLMTR
jgi:hypothetical protein